MNHQLKTGLYLILSTTTAETIALNVHHVLALALLRLSGSISPIKLLLFYRAIRSFVVSTLIQALAWLNLLDKHIPLAGSTR